MEIVYNKIQTQNKNCLINIISRVGVAYSTKWNVINDINVNLDQTALSSKMCLSQTLLDQDMQAIFKYVLKFYKIKK